MSGQFFWLAHHSYVIEKAKISKVQQKISNIHKNQYSQKSETGSDFHNCFFPKDGFCNLKKKGSGATSKKHKHNSITVRLLMSVAVLFFFLLLLLLLLWTFPTNSTFPSRPSSFCVFSSHLLTVTFFGRLASTEVPDGHARCGGDLAHGLRGSGPSEHKNLGNSTHISIDIKDMKIHIYSRNHVHMYYPRSLLKAICFKGMYY